MTVNVIKNFISLEYANKIILGSEVFLKQANGSRPGYFEDSHNRLPRPKEEYGKNIDPRATDEKSRDSDMLMSDSLHLAKKTIGEFYKTELNNCEGGLVKTTTGAHNGLHSDMYKLDGSPWEDGSGREDELEYSGLLYLSSHGKDFLGGELFFPQHDLKISPESGDLVFFRGDLEHTHEVTVVESGDRYAMIMFFGR